MLTRRLVLLLILVPGSYLHPNPSENYPQSAVLRSGNIVIYWKYNATHITFEVHGKTEGWVGIGFSPNGGMKGSDMFVGWVKNGQGFVTDRHGNDNAFPPKDTKQDISVLAGMECDGWTMLKFFRQIAACESDYDREITTNTERLIWALGAVDPVGGDLSSSDYHGTNRGSESLLILEPQNKPSETLPVGPEYEAIDVLANNVLLPSEPTYYNCRLFKIPDLGEKHHIVKIEPVIQQGNEIHVHHMVLFHCGTKEQNDTLIGTQKDCTNFYMVAFPNCYGVVAAWAIGGSSIVYPEIAGYSIGEPQDPAYLMLQTHYDNPAMKSGVVDSSGLRLTYTKSIRKHDIGVFETGYLVSPQHHFIPPGAESFLNVGHCYKDCLKQRLQQSGQENITVFASLLHSHGFGRKLRLRHFRDGIELPYIARDETFDFNYQEQRFTEKPVTLLPGDTLRMECVYNTEGETQMTMGGESTTEEMCLTFLMYYPKINLAYCLSASMKRQSWGYFGIENSNGTWGTLNDITVTKPEDLAGKTVMQVMNEYNWTEETIDKFSEEYASMRQVQMCISEEGKTKFEYYKPPEILQEYEPPVKECIETPTELFQNISSQKCTTASFGADTTTGGSPTLFTLQTNMLVILNTFMISASAPWLIQS